VVIFQPIVDESGAVFSFTLRKDYKEISERYLHSELRQPASTNPGNSPASAFRDHGLQNQALTGH